VALPPLGRPFAQTAEPVKDAAGAKKPFILDWA